MRDQGPFQRNRKDYIVADWYSDLNDAIAASDGRDVFVASARTQSTPITIPTALIDGFSLSAHGTDSIITYDGAGACFLTDPSATPATATRRQRWQLHNVYIVGPGSGVAGSIGLHLLNVIGGELSNVIVQGFETGVKWDGADLTNGAACYYNNAYNLQVTACGKAMLFAGQANSNKVFGGRAALSATGVEIEDDTTDVGLFGMDIEANTGDATYDAAVVISGYGNQLIGCRLENSGSTYDVAFDDAGGGNDGHKNTVISHHSAANVEARIRWDANRDNTVIWPGFFNLGDSSAIANTAVMRASRSVAADAEPFFEIADTYSSSGTPIGQRYRSRRFSIPFQAQIDDGAGSYYTTHEFGYASNKPHLWFGAFNSAAKDTNLYRDAANVLKTDDKFVIASTVGVLKLEPITLPATCAVGEMCVEVTTNELNICTATNTWTVVGTQT